jgi:L-lactate dehydrogenase complex protein LldG
VATAVATTQLDLGSEGGPFLPPNLPSVDLAEHFQSRLRAVEGIDHGPLPAVAVPDLVADLVADRQPGGYLAWDELGVAGVGSRLAGEGWRRVADAVPATPAGRRRHQEAYEALEVGITAADAGLAESGSIVLRTGPGRARMASLIPEVHIALLPVSRLYRSLSHYVADHPAAASGVSNLVVITGPSRTGDIEQQLNLGVHGPRSLHVILVA